MISSIETLRRTAHSFPAKTSGRYLNDRTVTTEPLSYISGIWPPIGSLTFKQGDAKKSKRRAALESALDEYGASGKCRTIVNEFMSQELFDKRSERLGAPGVNLHRKHGLNKAADEANALRPKSPGDRHRHH